MATQTSADGVVVGAHALGEALVETKRLLALYLTQSERHEMKIVVIGGTGLIGSKLVEQLRQDGH